MPAPVLVDGPVASTCPPLPVPPRRAGRRWGRAGGRWAFERRPWLRTSSLAADGLPIASLSVVSAVATAASPLLLDQPLLLVALTPRLPFLLLAAVSTPLPVFLVVAGLRLCLADVFWFRIGRRLGPRAIDRFPRLGRRLVSAPAWARDLLLAGAVVVRPIGRHLALAGALGASPLAIGVLDLVGTAAFLVAVHAGTGLVA